MDGWDISKQIISNRINGLEDYAEWLDRLRAENQQAADELARREQIAEDIRTGFATYYDLPEGE